jgi:hypothetical protein
MPPKLMQESPYKLYIQDPDGRYTELGEIASVQMEPNCSYEDYVVSPYEQLTNTSEMTISFRWDANVRMEYLLIYGKMPSNNWLRVHGYPMVRRCGYRKRKQK